MTGLNNSASNIQKSQFFVLYLLSLPLLLPFQALCSSLSDLTISLRLADLATELNEEEGISVSRRTRQCTVTVKLIGREASLHKVRRV